MVANRRGRAALLLTAFCRAAIPEAAAPPETGLLGVGTHLCQPYPPRRRLTGLSHCLKSNVAKRRSHKFSWANRAMKRE